MGEVEAPIANHEEIRQFVISNFLFGTDTVELSADSSFLESGIIDSTGTLELIQFIEEKYQITVDDEDLVPANLDSINRVVAYVNRKLQGSPE
ncbi:MAG: acyl carrier protein [Planctomycetes bacterium]|nr:acyl carrier protein [Planctomycetota bacterium]